jgi:hypothetical protein
MRKRWQGATRAAVALAAAYALALHAIVAGLALGAAPSAASFDPAHALCMPDEGGGNGPSDTPSHVHKVACCLADADKGAPPPPPGAALRVMAPTAVAMAWSSALGDLPLRPSFSPLGARAPPRLV